MGIVSLARHCFPIYVHPFCYKMFLKLTVIVTAIAKHEKRSLGRSLLSRHSAIAHMVHMVLTMKLLFSCDKFKTVGSDPIRFSNSYMHVSIVSADSWFLHATYLYVETLPLRKKVRKYSRVPNKRGSENNRGSCKWLDIAIIGGGSEKSKTVTFLVKKNVSFICSIYLNSDVTDIFT